jgi:hypothetical protein
MKCEVYFTLHIRPTKKEQIKCSEMSAFDNQTPGKYPEDYTQVSNSPQKRDLFTNAGVWFFCDPHRLPSEACWITFPIGEVAGA